MSKTVVEPNAAAKTAAVSRKSKIDIRKIVSVAMLCAISYVVMFVSKQIPVSVAGFLNLDFKDVIIAIGGFILGPLSAIFISVFVSLIEMVTVSSTGPIGCLMNILSTCVFVAPASLIYRRKHQLSGAVLGLVFGVLIMTVVMILWNYLITPLYMGVPRSVVEGMLIPVFLPYNLLKGGMNAALTVLLYKPIVGALRSAKLIAPSTSGAQPGAKAKVNMGVVLLALLVLATCVLLVLVLAGII